MSTDYQRYSIENQAAAIAVFAQQSGLTIVHTYRDDGRSGLHIKGRPGLTELIDDVQAGRADFGHVLVYDVSRWGRFQDVDESAHYEFLCKQSGVKVAYCAEQFDNDGSLLSSIVKNIKRVMAAEFSRELSVKVHMGQCRVAGLGFRVGGPLTFGLRRELVGEDRRTKGRLEKGERKALQTDRVRIARGSEKETAIVRWIFHQFVIERKTDAGIARQLNKDRGANHHGRPWTCDLVHNVLKNENYVGNITYNRTSRRLGQRLVNNPTDRWVRSPLVIDPIVDPSLFARAQRIMENRYFSVPTEEMLSQLRLLLKRKGRLTSNIVRRATGVPCVSSYVKHFGSLRKAFALIGYVPSRDCAWIDARQHWSAVIAEHARQVGVALTAQTNPDDSSVIRKGSTRIFFLTARQKKRRPNHVETWRVYRRKWRSGLLVVLRLDGANKEIADYLIFPTAKFRAPYQTFSTEALHGADRVETVTQLIAAMKQRLLRRGERKKHQTVA
jgi:DNA invertase Pin-like site-specific DNA recombinase